jgi:putative two-component system response regulator
MDQNELIRRLSGEYPWVLMVDDDPLQRLLIEEILEPPQYQLTYAPGGLGAGLAAPGRVRRGADRPPHARHGRRRVLPPGARRAGHGGAAHPDGHRQHGGRGLDGRPGGGRRRLAAQALPPGGAARGVQVAVQRKRAMDQLDSTESTLFALARMVEAKDENTGDHCSRLAHKAVLGRALGLPRPS